MWRRGSAGTAEELAWLNIGAAMGVTLLHQGDASHVALGTPARCQAALHAGVSPGSGTLAGRELLRAVLDGWCSDVTTSSSCEAGALLRAMRPQWFHQIPADYRNDPKVAPGHLWLDQADRSARSAAWSRLIRLNPQYEALRRAANPHGRGQKGTTEPWQNPARELARLHGPCWIAAEIAIAGAASRGTVGSGSIDREGEPFGENADYGTFVVTVHQRMPTDWWEAMHDKYADPLSRRTWSLALLATADKDIVISHLGRINACLTSLTDDEFLATASSSSRLGVMQRRRTLPARIWNASAGLAPRTRLLTAHFTARLDVHDPLQPLQDTELEALASPDAAAWPIARAVTSRLLNAPSPTLLRALAALGPTTAVDLPRTENSPGTSAAEVVPDANIRTAILDAPAAYPSSWTAAAERGHSLANEETSMEREALAEEWVPKVPRL